MVNTGEVGVAGRFGGRSVALSFNRRPSRDERNLQDCLEAKVWGLQQHAITLNEITGFKTDK